MLSLGSAIGEDTKEADTTRMTKCNKVWSVSVHNHIQKCNLFCFTLREDKFTVCCVVVCQSAFLSIGGRMAIHLGYSLHTRQEIMTGRGRADKDLMRGETKKHRTMLRGVVKKLIMRVPRRILCETILVLIYKEAHGVLKMFLANVTRDVVKYTEHAKK